MQGWESELEWGVGGGGGGELKKTSKMHKKVAIFTDHSGFSSFSENIVLVSFTGNINPPGGCRRRDPSFGKPDFH